MDQRKMRLRLQKRLTNNLFVWRIHDVENVDIETQLHVVKTIQMEAGSRDIDQSIESLSGMQKP